MDVIPIAIIWCDASFENERSYRTMREEFNRVTTGQTPPTPRVLTEIDLLILSFINEEFRSNPDWITFVANADDALKKINEYRTKKLFLITSGTLGEYLVPEVARNYPDVNHIYLFAHNLEIHLTLADEYAPVLRMFNFPTTLLLRLTRDISQFFIERGRLYLESSAPCEALGCFRHSQNLEIAANTHDRSSDFRQRLNLLEGPQGLIAQAIIDRRRQGFAEECTESCV